MRHLCAILASMLALSLAFAASAKDKKKNVEKDDDGKEIVAKVWFKNGSGYN